MVSLGDGAGAYYYFDTIQLFLEHGADVDALDDTQSTPLHMASEYGNSEATQLLFECGASVHLQNNEGDSPKFASVKGHTGSRRSRGDCALVIGAFAE